MYGPSDSKYNLKVKRTFDIKFKKKNIKNKTIQYNWKPNVFVDEKTLKLKSYREGQL